MQHWKSFRNILLLLVATAGVPLYYALPWVANGVVDYDRIADHFKYGSIGSEPANGIPYWIWKALPELFSDKLPGKGYASLGFIQEEGQDRPIGFSIRRVFIDRVSLNCGVCHTGSVRETPGAAPRIKRIEDWLLDATPPAYPFPVDAALASQGEPIHRESCANCHGENGRKLTGMYVGKVVPVAEIGTDRHRLDSYTYELHENQNTLYAGYPWRFKQFRKTNGYANMPLDGLWLRAPYLHNGSVPTLQDLLSAPEGRAGLFKVRYSTSRQQ